MSQVDEDEDEAQAQILVLNSKTADCVSWVCASVMAAEGHSKLGKTQSLLQETGPELVQQQKETK